MEKKVCSKCGVEKELNQYPIQKDCIMGIRSYCIDCKRKQNRDYREKNRDKILQKQREQQKISSEKIKNKKDKELNDLIEKYTNLKIGKEIIITKYAGYFTKHKNDKYPRHYFEKKCLLCEKTSLIKIPQIENYIKKGVNCQFCKGNLRFNEKDEIEKKCGGCQKWFLPNENNFVKSKNKTFGLHYYCINCHKEKSIKRRESPEVRKKEYLTYKNRLDTDSLFKFKRSIINLIRVSIKNRKFSKKTKTAKILGCTYDEFRIGIESKWENWMSWDNYGLYNGKKNYGWDLDHIIPTSSAKTEEESIILNHHTNFQPLCSYVNRYVKKDKIDWC
jgi:hypothetical protein